MFNKSLHDVKTMTVQHVLRAQAVASKVTINFNLLPALPRGRGAAALIMKEYLGEVRRALMAWEYRKIGIDE